MIVHTFHAPMMIVKYDSNNSLLSVIVYPGSSKCSVKCHILRLYGEQKRTRGNIVDVGIFDRNYCNKL